MNAVHVSDRLPGLPDRLPLLRRRNLVMRGVRAGVGGPGDPGGGTPR